jgi:HD-like signal output (HDOD) protein
MMTINEIIEQTCKTDISSIPIVINKILDIIKNQFSSATDLKRTIEIDPVLTARVMRVANSSCYARNRKSTSLLEAIVSIGFNAVKEIVISHNANSLFNDKKVSFGYSRPLLWKHSVAVAVCSKMIYRKVFQESGENAYCAGLVHDLGIIVEEQFLKDVFYSIVKNSFKKKIALLEEERTVFGFSHADIGRELSKKWDLPSSFETVFNYDEKFIEKENSVSEEDMILSNTITASNYICREMNLGYSEMYKNNRDTYLKCIQCINLSEVGVKIIEKEVVDKIQFMTENGWF